MSSALTLYDASAPLLSRRFTATSPSFPQSGSWNWVGLIDSGVQGAVKILSRYSAAGVDPYTLIIGQIACSNFKLSTRSAMRLQNAIMDLKSMNSIGNFLHFGFGIDSVVRNLAATEEGGILVALCASATESFATNHAANILWELIRTFKAPEKQRPSQLQWKALLQVCAGTLAETEFPALAEHLMHLCAENDRLAVGRYETETHRQTRGVSSPDTMAEALVAIGKVSMGDMVAISIVGGGDAGWLAAVAQWVFDLRIAVFTSDGELLHATSAQEGQPQVQFIFVKPSEEGDDLKVAVQGQVYRLRDITELFFMQENEFGSALVCSRVPWAQALSLVFGSDFKRLAEMRLALGNALSSAGRIFDGICKADPKVLVTERQHCQTYFKDARGRGFLSFASALFPEIGEVLNGSTNSNGSGSFDSACQAFESSIAHIKLGCGCSICKKGIEDGLDEENWCLVLLLEAIIVIIQSMSGISAPPTLYPMRSGIEAFYRRQLKLHEHEKLQSRMKHYGPIGAVLEFNNAECEEWNIEESVAVRRVIDAARLFSGRNIQSISHEQVAISVSGIVAFLNTLIDGGLSVDPELMGRCTVMCGHIEMHGRPYLHLEDLSDYDLVGMDYREGRHGGGPGPDPLFDPSTLTDAYTRVSLVAKEGIESVKVGLSFHEAQGERTTVLGPANLAQQVLRATGLFKCNNSKSCSHDSVEFQQDVSDYIKLVATHGHCETWLFQGSSMGRLVALIRVLDIQPMFYQILQHEECLQCCIEAAELSQYEKAIIISKRQSPKRKRLGGESL